MGEETEFCRELQHLLNKHGKDTATNIPDFVLARHLETEVDSLASLTEARDRWFGFKPFGFLDDFEA